MYDPDHDWNKIIPCNNKFKWIDRIILGIILLSLSFATVALFLSLFKPEQYCL